MSCSSDGVIPLGESRYDPAKRGFPKGNHVWWGFLFLSRKRSTWRCVDWQRAHNRQQKSRPKAAILCNGASDRARTGDPRFTRAVLYQLSYAGGHMMTQLRRQRLSMIRDIAHPRKCSDGFSHFKCTNIGDAMSCSYGSQTEWGGDGSTQDSSHTHRRPVYLRARH